MIAIFEGMLDIREDRRGQVIARGPFIVEVCAGEKPTVFIARVKPTNQPFYEALKDKNGKWVAVLMTRSSEAELRIQIECRFQNKIKDWHEVGDQASSAATDGSAVAPRSVK